MSTYTWAGVKPFVPNSFTWGLRTNDRLFTSELSGAIQTTGVPGDRWAAALTFGAHGPAERAALEAFFAKCRREHRLSLWNLARPQPFGTINQTGVTLGAAAAQFASQITLAGCGASKTLKAGDMLGLPGQLLMVADDATSNGSGSMTVNLTGRLRSAQTSGSTVTLVKPKALFILASDSLDFPFLGTHAPGMTVELTEVFA